MATHSTAASKQMSGTTRRKPIIMAIDPSIVVSSVSGRLLTRRSAAKGSKAGILRGSKIRIKYKDTNNVDKNRTPRQNSSEDLVGAIVTLTTTERGVTVSRPYRMLSDDDYLI